MGLSKYIDNVITLAKTYPLRALLIFVVIVGIVLLILDKYNVIKYGFENVPTKSSYGYLYDAGSYRIASPADREVARLALLQQLNKSGYGYTIEDMRKVVFNDFTIISMLEVDDDEDKELLYAKTVVLLDPTYQLALKYVAKVERSGRFSSDIERQVVYDLIVKYLTKIGKSTKAIPLSVWKDDQLAKTLRTFKIPAQNEFKLPASSAQPLNATAIKSSNATSYNRDASFADAYKIRSKLNSMSMEWT